MQGEPTGRITPRAKMPHTRRTPAPRNQSTLEMRQRCLQVSASLPWANSWVPSRGCPTHHPVDIEFQTRGQQRGAQSCKHLLSEVHLRDHWWRLASLFPSHRNFVGHIHHEIRQMTSGPNASLRWRMLVGGVAHLLRPHRQQPACRRQSRNVTWVGLTLMTGLDRLVPVCLAVVPRQADA